METLYICSLQATVNGRDFPSQDRREVVTIPALELALDTEVPAIWPRIDALKLSVNGAERNTLVPASDHRSEESTPQGTPSPHQKRDPCVF